MSTTYQSNDDEIDAWLRRSIDGFSFADGNVGQKIVDEVATGIQDRSEQQQRGATVDWPENSDNPPGKGYKSRKRRLYGTDKTNYRTKQMLSRESLLGEVVITPKSIEIRYGTGQPPTSGANGYIEDADRRVTDVEKAYFAAQSGREFFELDDAIKDRTFEIFVDGFADHLRSC